MKKQDIITLANLGIMSMTAHTLKPAQAYKAFKLKREMEKAYTEISEEHKAIREANGLTEEYTNKIQAILDKININLNVSEDERRELLANNEKNRTVDSLILEANKGEIKIDIKTIPFEDWRLLQSENRAKNINGREFDILGGKAEVILEGIFWEEPKE